MGSVLIATAPTDIHTLSLHDALPILLPFDWRADFVRVTEDAVLTPVTLQFRNKDLSWQEQDGVHTFTGVKTDRKSTRLNSSHVSISYAVFCLKKKYTTSTTIRTTYAR